MPLRIPETILLDTCNKALKILRDDYAANIAQGTEERSLLYTLMFSLDLGTYNLYDNAKALIITTPENPKHIDVISLSFDRNQGKSPHLYITLPSESTINNSIGIGEGDFPEIFYDNSPEPDQFRKQFNRRYLSTYHLVIVAENRNETLILYHLFKNMLVACTNHLAMNGVEMLKIGGQDLQSGLTPPDILFRKAITLSFEYEQQIPELFIRNIYSKILLYWKPEGAVTRQGPIVIDADDSF